MPEDEKTECPLCETPNAFTPPVWPAFYEAGEGNILWVSAAGEVVNGGWKPIFSEDRQTCWAFGGPVFRRVGPAPYAGRYNDVIEEFRQSRGEVRS